jgi:hypothetical protein
MGVDNQGDPSSVPILVASVARQAGGHGRTHRGVEALWPDPLHEGGLGQPALDAPPACVQ